MYEPVKPVKIDIISGFLGAGKTTLISKLLQEAYLGEKIALLENEFGEIAIDGDILDHHGITIKEIANGCICCTLQGNFINGIVELVQKNAPDRIIIEPTGLSHLRDIIFACREAAKSVDIAINCIITVVDATRFPMFMEVSGEFYRHQIGEGRTIVLSAVQNLEEEDNLDEIISGIRNLNPHAPIFTKPWDEMDGLELLQVAEESGMMSHFPTDSHHHVHHRDHHRHGKEDYESFSLRMDKVWTDKEIKELFHNLAEGINGCVFRAKGFLPTEAGMVKVDYVYGRGKTEPSPYTGPGKIVIIGRDLAPQGLV
ncbi:MAG: CobW family GTP-binding protein [Dehalobacterium sp.]